MTPTEILSKAGYDDVEPEELDEENAQSGLEKKLAKGYDPNHIDTRVKENLPVTILYHKNGASPIIGDGNHRVRALSKIAPNKPIPVLHWRMSN